MYVRHHFEGDAVCEERGELQVDSRWLSMAKNAAGGLPPSSTHTHTHPLILTPLRKKEREKKNAELSVTPPDPHRLSCAK